MVHPRPSGVARLIRVHSPQVGVLRWTLRAAKSTTPTLLVSRSGLALEGASLVLIAHRGIVSFMLRPRCVPLYHSDSGSRDVSRAI